MPACKPCAGCRSHKRQFDNRDFGLAGPGFEAEFGPEAVCFPANQAQRNDGSQDRRSCGAADLSDFVA